ncbi:endolytic transglycosylase MltG [Thermodesulfobacteriota bacterium B35]
MRLSALWVAALLLVAALVAGGWFWSWAHTPLSYDTATVIRIPRGSGVRRITTLLAGAGILDDDLRFPLLARLTGLGGRLRAGEFRLPPGLSPLALLHLLERGEVVRHRVTVPEGWNVRQVASFLAARNWVDADRFLALARDRQFIRSLGLDEAGLEGYLFPDTYVLERGATDERLVLTMMVSRFLAVWKELAKDSHTGLSRHQVVTLASIVEKETAAAAERPLIARVFLNRLARGMRLQSDPTVIYGLAGFDGNLTRRDLRTRTPYNTYVIPGLPPGPICNPGRAALVAVLHPADSDVLYFVSRNDGTHQFSRTLREHNRAVRRFQRARNRQQTKE